MKGILIEPGKEPVVTTLPDTLQGIEALLRCPCEQKVLPRTPAVLFFRTAASRSTVWCAASPCAAPSSAMAGVAATSSRCPVPCSPSCWTV